MPLGERLQIPRAAAVAEDPEHPHQPQIPLRVPHPAPVAAIRDRLEEADQVIRSSLIDCSRVGLGAQKRRDPPTKADADDAAKTYRDRLLGDPVGNMT